MSLCRYHLAEGNLEAVEKLLPILEPLLTNSNGYRSFHSVTHLYLLKVRWLYKKSQVKDPNYAVAQLRLLVDASKPNKELESYFSKVADELQPAGR
jgi:hypothetical protein